MRLGTPVPHGLRVLCQATQARPTRLAVPERWTPTAAVALPGRASLGVQLPLVVLVRMRLVSWPRPIGPIRAGRPRCRARTEVAQMMIQLLVEAVSPDADPLPAPGTACTVAGPRPAGDRM